MKFSKIISPSPLTEFSLQRVKNATIFYSCEPLSTHYIYTHRSSWESLQPTCSKVAFNDKMSTLPGRYWTNKTNILGLGKTMTAKAIQNFNVRKSSQNFPSTLNHCLYTRRSAETHWRYGHIIVGSIVSGTSDLFCRFSFNFERHRRLIEQKFEEFFAHEMLSALRHARSSFSNFLNRETGRKNSKIVQIISKSKLS